MSQDASTPRTPVPSDHVARNPLAVLAFLVAAVGLAGFLLGLGALGSLANDHVGPAQVFRILFPIWAVLALILGILGRAAARSRDGRGRRLATAAVVIAIIEVIGAIFFAFALTACLNDAFHCR
jgi:hypothetical protein